MEKSELVEALREVLHENRTIIDEIHQEHHDYIALLLKREQRKEERWEKIKTQVFGWGAISFLSAIGLAVYNFFFKPGGG